MHCAAPVCLRLLLYGRPAESENAGLVSRDATQQSSARRRSLAFSEKTKGKKKGHRVNHDAMGCQKRSSRLQVFFILGREDKTANTSIVHNRVRICCTKNRRLLDFSGVVMVISQRVEAFMTVPGVESLLEGVHARINLQHAVPIAS